MTCKFCGAELMEGKPFCPSCGRSQTETPEVEKEEIAAAPEIKEGVKNPGKIALIVTGVVVVLAVLVALIVGGMGGKVIDFTSADPTQAPTELPGEAVSTEPPGTIPADGNPDDVTCKGSYTVGDDVALEHAGTVVATMGGKELTNGELQVYYWEEIYAFLNEYGSYASYFGLDYTKGLDTQSCAMSETPMTWQQYFLEGAINTWRSYQAMSLERENFAIEMDEATATYLEGLRESMTEMAKQGGYESLEAMIASYVGIGPSVEDYIHFVELYNEGYVYFSSVYDSTNPTAEEIDAYFTENEASYAENDITRDSGKYVDVRHVLIMPEGGETGEDGYPVYTEEAWAAAEAEAQRIYNLWLEGDRSEESFHTLAQEYSVDGSAPNGGLYTEVAAGDMVPAFNDWCFDETRVAGDHGLVKTEYGYHIMYFVQSRDIWYVHAEYDLKSQTVSAIVPAALEKYPAEVDYSAIKLGLVELG